MTETLHRPPRPASAGRASPTEPARSLLQAGLAAAAWAVGAGLVATALPVLLVWMADARSGSSAAEALRTVGQVWLVAHGVALRLPAGAFGLAPLGLLVLPALLLLRAGGHSARECRVSRLPAALQLAAAIAVPYGVLAAVVAGLARTASVQPVSWQALVGGTLVGGLGGVAGVLRGAGLWPAVLPALPARVARLLVAATASVGVLVGVGALLAGTSLAVHLDRAQDLTRASSPGLVGGAALLLLGLSMVPNAAVWGLAWVSGPGFAVGTATAVGPFAHTLGAVPSVPVLAALPGAVPAWVGALTLVVPLAAGAIGGVLVLRRLTEPSWQGAAREAALVGPVAGVVVGLACWASGGPLGGGRLVEVGPSAWQVGLAVTLELGVAAAVAAVTLVRRRS